jgi:hypothetical protein
MKVLSSRAPCSEMALAKWRADSSSTTIPDPLSLFPCVHAQHVSIRVVMGTDLQNGIIDRTEVLALERDDDVLPFHLSAINAFYQASNQPLIE